MAYASKLTEEQVVAIRQDGRIAREVALAFGISTQNVYEIRRGHIWKLVGGPRKHRPRVGHGVIRAIRADDRNTKAIADAHGVSKATVRRIRRGESWAAVL